VASPIGRGTSHYPVYVYQLTYPTGNSPYTTSIHILDDDSLLNIFYLYRPFLLGEEDQNVNIRFKGGGQWARERWWYRLAHVCQRWRNLILGSASYLGLCLVCTYGTPVADMLVHSPPLPLVIDIYDETRDITAKDEEAIILALEQRDRVRRIRFLLPVLKHWQQKLIMAIDGEYPILEYLILWGLPEEKRTVFTLPGTLQTPHLRHMAINSSFLIQFQLLMTAVGLVTLHVALYHPSTYFQPTVLLQSLSMMPQLEILLIAFHYPIPNRDVERHLNRTPIMTHVTLPNLRTLALKAVGAFSEAVLGQITASHLEILEISYPERFTFFVPQLLQFMERTENFRFDRARFNFSNELVYVGVNPPETNMPVSAFSIVVNCWHLDEQVSSVAQIFTSLSKIFSAVEHLILAHEVHSRSSEEHNEADRTEWRKLLRSFGNVKTLRVHHGLVEELSRCLRLEDGEHPLELLPELQKLIYSGSGNANDDAFTPFIDSRQNAGRPVTLIKS
jgi:hypothetical protein